MSRRLPALAALSAAALTLAGCAALPDAPGPLATTWVPAASVSPGDVPAALSPDGFNSAQRMTVRVRNIGCGFIATGTGFALDENTLITNQHVISDSRSIEVSTYNGVKYTATTVSSTSVADIAIVRTEDPIGTSYAILAQEDPEIGDAITVLGYPGGGQLTSVDGVILGTTSDPIEASVGTVYVSSASVVSGSSGSPALNEAGEVVGVVYAKIPDGTNNSLIIPVSTLRTLLSETSLMIPEALDCETDE
ncbi:serine protease [Demequina sp. NBRC 110052]|uniref:S1 family peptidase n=1 Tax=Demequina sp. NBRC 110052 TaxID=1570341 RepID=UPI000A069973|nr:serine protease [Demequina sp. NBRC 110052]